MSDAAARPRAEERFPLRLFVRLYLSEGAEFEIAQTVDISRHGARVFTRKFHPPNQNLVLRSLRGNLTSYARVAHCQPVSDTSYCLGLELYNPIGEWSSTLPSSPPKA